MMPQGAQYSLQRLIHHGAVTGLALAGIVHGVPVLAMNAEVTGVDKAIEKNVKIYLEPVKSTAFNPERLVGEVERLTKTAMRPFGYYEPEIDVTLQGKQALVDIKPGEPVLIQVIDFSIQGEAEHDPPFINALDAYPQKKGEILLHAPYDTLRDTLASLSLQRGYFDWGFLEHRMEIRPWENSARLYLDLDSGERYHFGDTLFQGSHIEIERLSNLLPYEAGDPYLSSKVAKLSQDLAQTRWFNLISVRPRLDIGQLALPPQELGFYNELGVDGIDPVPLKPQLTSNAIIAATRVMQVGSPSVPMDVVLAPADRHQFEFGIGFSTDVGPRGRIRWKQPWINRYGHSLDHDLRLSAPEQQFSGEYRMPLDDPLRDSYRLQYGLRNQDNSDINALEASIELGRHWKFANDWEQTIYLRATYEDFTLAGEKNQVLLLYPGVRWNRSRTRNPNFPTWGDSQQLTIQYSNKAWGSGAEFFRINGDTQWIRMLGENNRFIARMNIGAIETDDFRDIPSSLRFFAGGDNSVRGYSYDSLSPRDSRGRLIGGQQRFVTSFEAQRRITGKWWLASFVDTGDAFTKWAPDDLNTGAGVGVRWISPVGPIRFDVAHPFDNDDNFRIHFAIGPEF